MTSIESCLAHASLVLLLALVTMRANAAEELVLSVDRFVPHVSTVPINKGNTVGLHLRERVLAGVAQKAEQGSPAPVVLFLHGGFSPAPVAYDLNYKDYSWMEYLARAGFDVFALAHTAYGFSPKPGMDDPCNVVASQQKLLIPHVLKEPCAPRYPYKMVHSQSEWDEIESAVNYILQLRGVKKLSMVGWSTGTPRIGGFAAKYPEKVDRIVFFAPAPFPEKDGLPAVIPESGAPVLLQTRERLEKERWLADVKCQGQIDDDSVRDEMWKQLMAQEGIGANWTPGGLMRAPNRMNYGWRSNVPKIKAPTLVLLGEFDNFEKRQDSWKALTVEQKVFIKIACGSHYMQYEKNRKVLHEASKQWLQSGAVIGVKQGTLTADADGNIRRQEFGKAE